MRFVSTAALTGAVLSLGGLLIARAEPVPTSPAVPEPTTPAPSGSGSGSSEPTDAGMPDGGTEVIEVAQDASVPPRDAGVYRPLPVKSEREKAAFLRALLAKMTLEEKAGQLTQWGAQQTPTGPQVKSGNEDDIRHGRVGSFIGAYGAETTRRLQKVAVEESRLKIPLLFSFDVVHGFRTTFPVPLAESSAFDPELARRTARAASVEATAAGLHWTYAPMVDIGRDPRWGRVVEGAGEDPFLGAALAAARVEGVRGPATDTTRMIATAKHFVAYGAAEAGRDYNTVDVSERALHEVYLPPFRAAVAANVDAIMPAFNEVAGTPMHAHRPLLRELLRGVWGFDGIAVSDYTGVMELMRHGIASTPAEATERAMAATVDVDMIADFYLQELPSLVRSGKVPERDLDAAVLRVLEAKQRLGLFEDPYRYSDEALEQANMITPATRALTREAAQKSIVLLKNNHELLPLKKDLGTLAVIGALAEDRQSTLGAWAGIGKPSDTVTVLEGIRSAVSPQTNLIYARGASSDSDNTLGFADAERAAQQADATIVVVGEHELMSGEAHNRTSIELPGAQLQLLAHLYTLNKPLVIVLMNGRALALGDAAGYATALVETWYLGLEMGNAIADVLFGDVNPSGKLPVTFPRVGGQIPIYYAHKNTGRPPREEEVYTSKYLDEKWTPLYAFGHGLSYTQFTYEAPILSQNELGPTDKLTVTVTVRNVGARAGDEVVQLYLRDDAASFTRPVRQLRGFTRVSLEPGQSKQITFTLDQDDFALLDENLQRIVEPGTFAVFVGGSSETDNAATFKVTKPAKLKGLGNPIPRAPVVK
jgi:beta-glucosidase